MQFTKLKKSRWEKEHLFQVCEIEANQLTHIISPIKQSNGKKYDDVEFKYFVVGIYLRCIVLF